MTDDSETGVTLKEHLASMMDEREKRFLERAATIEIRLSRLNELREEVVKDRSQFLQKNVYDQMHEALEQRVTKLETFYARLVGIGTMLVLGSALIGAAIRDIFFKR